MKRRLMTPDWAVPAAALAFYLLNRLLLKEATQGWLNYFLCCYANDIFAGAAILAWFNLLLTATGLRPVRRLRLALPFLLLCGLVWELAAPIWHPSAVFDPWDLAAYQLGGLMYMLISARYRYRKNPDPRTAGARFPTSPVQTSSRRAIVFSSGTTIRPTKVGLTCIDSTRQSRFAFGSRSWGVR